MNSYYEKILVTGEVKCIDEDIPFDVPQGWEWCRIASLADVVRGGSPRPAGSPIFYDGSIPFLKVADLTRESSIYVKSFSSTIKEAGLSKTRLVEAGTLLLTNSGATLGVPKICTFDTTFNDGVAAFLSLDERLKLYVYWFFCYMTDLYRNINQGTAQPNLNTDIIKMTLVPIPPYKEQIRIIEQLENISPIIAYYEKAQDELDELNESIPKLIKQSILQEAIRGKLVPQIAEEGTAKELLKQIKEEKLKLVKEGKLKKSALNDSVIFLGDDNKYWEKNGESEYCIDDIVPFELPPTWCWVRHNQLFEISGGSQPPKSQFIERPQEGYIRLYQIRDYGNSPLPVFIPKEKASKITKKGDIILARYGASLGKVFFAEDGAYNVAMAKVIPQFPENLICKEFLFLFYKTSIYQKLVKDRSRCAQAGFNKEDLNDLLFPLPPLKEQHRIVERFKNVTSIMS